MYHSVQVRGQRGMAYFTDDGQLTGMMSNGTNSIVVDEDTGRVRLTHGLAQDVHAHGHALRNASLVDITMAQVMSMEVSHELRLTKMSTAASASSSSSSSHYRGGEVMSLLAVDRDGRVVSTEAYEIMAMPQDDDDHDDHHHHGGTRSAVTRLTLSRLGPITLSGDVRGAGRAIHNITMTSSRLIGIKHMTFDIHDHPAAASASTSSTDLSMMVMDMRTGQVTPLSASSSSSSSASSDRERVIMMSSGDRDRVIMSHVTVTGSAQFTGESVHLVRPHLVYASFASGASSLVADSLQLRSMMMMRRKNNETTTTTTRPEHDDDNKDSSDIKGIMVMADAEGLLQSVDGVAVDRIASTSMMMTTTKDDSKPVDRRSVMTRLTADVLRSTVMETEMLRLKLSHRDHRDHGHHDDDDAAVCVVNGSTGMMSGSRQLNMLKSVQTSELSVSASASLHSLTITSASSASSSSTASSLMSASSSSDSGKPHHRHRLLAVDEYGHVQVHDQQQHQHHDAESGALSVYGDLRCSSLIMMINTSSHSHHTGDNNDDGDDHDEALVLLGMSPSTGKVTPIASASASASASSSSSSASLHSLRAERVKVMQSMELQGELRLTSPRTSTSTMMMMNNQQRQQHDHDDEYGHRLLAVRRVDGVVVPLPDAEAHHDHHDDQHDDDVSVSLSALSISSYASIHNLTLHGDVRLSASSLASSSSSSS